MTDTYTHGHHASVLRSHSWRTAENSAAYLLPHLREDMSLLDVGCGPGTITVDLARRLPRGRVLGIDPSGAVVDRASAYAVQQDCPNVAFATGDVYDLALDDDSIDVAHAHQVLQHLTDPVAALREMARVVRPGGLIAVRDADYAAMFWAPRLEGLDRWQRLYDTVARSNDAEPNAARHLKRWAREAGLDDVTCTVGTWCYATAEETAWWGDLWAERAQESDFARQALERGLATQAELDEVSAVWREWAVHEDAWLAIPNGELLIRVR